MGDVLVIISLIAVFAAAAAYVWVCDGITAR